MKDRDIRITKSSGEAAIYEEEKLRASLERAGAGSSDIAEVLQKVRESLVDGISTRRLYHVAYAALRKKSRKAAGKYRLKKAIFDLGPTGYPFEKFVGELLAYQGYRVKTGLVVKGRCVDHEVDVLAEKGNRKIIVECKFHNTPGRKSDVKVALYFHSRFLDIRKLWSRDNGDKETEFEGWIVTNTRFTADATIYGKCAGLHLVAWDYPGQGNLKERIDIAGFHPVTALSELTKREMQELLDRDIVLCRSIRHEHLQEMKMPENRIRKVLDEAQDLVTD